MHLKEWQAQFLSELQSPTSNSQHVYQACLLETKLASLKKTYPASLKMIGDTAFESIAGTFINTLTLIPSDIGMLGKAFPDFIASHPISSSLPYLSALAQFEWHWHCAFNAPEPDFNQANLHLTLQSKSDQAILKSKKQLWVHTYAFAVDELWACCQAEYAGDFQVNTTPQKTTILIFREQFHVRVMILDDQLAELRAQFDGTKTIEKIYQGLSNKDLQINFDKLFIQLCNLGLLE